MGIKYLGLLLVFLLPTLISGASAAIYVENASVLDFSLSAAPGGLSSSLNGIQPRIFTEDVDSLLGKNFIVAPGGLDNSLNAVRPRIFTEDLDAIFGNNLVDTPSTIDNSLSQVRPRIFTDHVDSLWYPLMAPYTGTLIPPPLVANIELPTNNFYSEELVNFRGTASGGVPPYTYTWISDKIGTLSTITTASTSDEFSKLLPFNKIQEMNKHTITLTVTDSAGNTITKTAELNVVKQKIKILVVPIATSGSELSPENRIKIDTLADEAKEFYLKSSYGAIYLDFDTSFNSVVNVVKSDVKSAGESVLIDTISQLQTSPYSIDLSKYGIVVIVNTENLLLDNGYTSELAGALAEDQLLPTTVVPLGVRFSFAIWVHEIGHTLGYSIKISETYPLLLWSGKECQDLYSCGNVKPWDIMANGGYVYSETDHSNQPTDMSVLSKTKLKWLTRDSFVGEKGYGDHSVMSLENMHYVDSALVYKPSISSNAEYYIEARELPKPSYYQAPLWKFDCSVFGCTLNNGILIYKVVLQDGKISVNILYTNSELKPTFSAVDGTTALPVIDVPEFIKFSVTKSNSDHPYNAEVKIEPCNIDCQKLEGVLVDGETVLYVPPVPGPFPGPAFRSAGNGTVPDLDLHAITPDGKHIGMNYTSGEYEMQIPGGVASGDLIGGEEWIFVPTGTEIRYYIDSHDVQKYLEENPGVDPANATMNYSTTLMEYGENPQRVELPDGNWAVSNRTVSAPQNDIIEPGVIKEIVPETPVSITNLTFGAGAAWLNFTWANPSDPDFSHVMLYLNGTFKTNIMAPQNYYNFTELEPNTVYELGTHTVDSSGNVNETWVNATGRTAPSVFPPIQISNPNANPAIILNDNGRPRPLGTNITRLNVTVTGNVASVSIDLSPIGGSAAAPMTKISGTDIYSLTTNAKAGINLTNNLVMNATGTNGNFNNSVGISLTVLLRGDFNGDGKIDLKDLLNIRRCIAGLCSINPFVADIQPAEGDGKVDLKDLLFLRRYLAGLEPVI